MEIILPYSPPAVVTATIAQRSAHRVSSFIVVLVSLWEKKSYYQFNGLKKDEKNLSLSQNIYRNNLELSIKQQ